MKWAEADALRTSRLVLNVVKRVLLNIVKQILDLGFLLVASATFWRFIFAWLQTPCNIVYLSLAGELLENLLAQHLFQSG